MSTQSIVQGNNGKLNKDLEPAYLNQGDYLDAKNVRYFTRDGQTTGSHENVYGNEYAFDIETLTAQEKVYGLVPGAGSTTLTFYYSNGVVIGTTGAITNYATFQSQISALLPSARYQKTFTTDGTSYYVGVTPYSLGGSLLIGLDYSVTSSNPNWFVFLSKEPIMQANSGPNKVIGSKTIDDDLFILSTPNELETLPNNKYLATFVSNSNPGISFTISKTNDLPQEGVVRLISSNEVKYSGQHIYYKDTSNPLNDKVYLIGYFASPAPVGPIYLSYVSVGYGTIGVAQKNENNETWTYTRLLTSSEFNFSTLYQADVIGEKNNRGISLYWTDNLNVPRSFYYYGDYVTDGALNSVNSLNKYVIGNISKQTRLQYGYAGATIDYGGQAGGKLNCGNYRYAVRFTTREGVNTNWSLLSNPFSVFLGTNDPYHIRGGDANTDSKKSNIINVSWNDNYSYDYIQFCYVRFIEDATVGTGLFSTEAYTFGRTRLTSGQRSISYIHDGYETDIAELTPLSQLRNSTFVIKKAKNIRSLDNRLVLSNVNIAGNEDSLVDLFESITYSVEKQVMDSIGTFAPESQPTLTQRATSTTTTRYSTQRFTQAREYMDPANIFKYVGYMMNETYRFYGAVEYLDGTLSDAYYLFDTKICTDADFTAGGGSDPKRNASSTFTDYTINIGATTAIPGWLGQCLRPGVSKILIPYVKIKLPASLPPINGVDAKKVINKIHIFRADVTQKTILANGIGILALQGLSPYSSNVYYFFNGSVMQNCTPENSANLASFPFIADTISNDTFNAPAPSTYPYTLHNLNSISYSQPYRKAIDFHSQDHLLSNERMEYYPGDKVINYGHYDNYYYDGNFTAATKLGYLDDSSYTNYHGFGSFYFCGRFGNNTYLTNSLDTTVFPDSPVLWLEDGGEAEYFTSAGGGSKKYSKKSTITWYAGNYTQHNFYRAGYLLLVDTDVVKTGLHSSRTCDYGTHYMSYYRPLTIDQQYGSSTIATIIPTNAFYDVQQNTTQLGTLPTLNEINVFGGDTYTCKSLMRYRFTDPDNKVGGVTDGGRWGVGIEFYSQSRVNPQIVYNSDPAGPNQINKIWPFDSIQPQNPPVFQSWFNSGNNNLIETRSYNGSYSQDNKLNSLAIYDPDIYYENKQPATIYYSEPKLQESLIDSYSYIGPSNRKDLDVSFGDINHHEIYNGQLITFQERSMNRQFFNSTTMISNPDTQVVLGDGGQVLSRRGETLSAYGLKNKWSVILGRSKGGNDVLYWYDATTRKIMRFAYDGVVPISVRGNIDSFIWNNTNFVQMYDTPAHGEGITGVWNEKYNEAIFTFRAKKLGIQEYSEDLIYPQGSIVHSNLYGYDDFHQTGEIYIRNNIAFNLVIGAPTYPYPDSPYWNIIPHNNNEYYNEFTIVFSEDKNGFTTFYSPKPKIYIPFKDGYLTPVPLSEYGQYIYENDRGTQCVWYDGLGIDPLEEDAYIEGVINYNPELIKTAEAISIDANTTPERVDVRSAQHSTYMLSANNDFASIEGMYRSPVKNDFNPDGDNSRVYGRWFGVKYTMVPGYRQAIRSFVLKIRARNRMYNK